MYIIVCVCKHVWFQMNVRVFCTHSVMGKELFWIGLFVVKKFGVKIRKTRLKYAKLTSSSTQMGEKGLATLHALRSHRTVWFVFAAQTRFLLEKGIAGHERLYLAKWHPKARKLRKRPFFDIADRHESCTVDRGSTPAPKDATKLAGGVLSLFSSLSFDISIKYSVQR